ncbi:hypothetical protein BpHYR1_013396 [Brachionus plicatilis]|uniref:Uncharacterized protein n=1 Tax=Brachionus plicatilis TaxID=10195 RepID=A0A3M7Q7K0_BRAPC|nr:hypothetical protein BpHYR1_013396 [Brachionus plicatilis]
MFKSCFASSTSSSLSCENDSAKFIFDTFRQLKLNSSLIKLNPKIGFIIGPTVQYFLNSQGGIE